MIANSKLLIDKNCPMCHIYGKCFTKLKWIDTDTVAYYQTIHATYTNSIDMERAKSEIALHEIKNNKTYYGIDSIIRIAGYNRPYITSILNWRPVYQLLSYFYAFISYNRKVIVPSSRIEGERDCSPSIHRGYRSAYIVLVAFITGMILNTYLAPITDYIGLGTNPYREYIICFGQVGWQLNVIHCLHKKLTLDYLGNMSTVSLVGGLLLLPIVLISQFVIIPLWICIVWFAMVVCYMLAEHIRRCRILGITILMSFSWIFYRMVALLLLFIIYGL